MPLGVSSSARRADNTGFEYEESDSHSDKSDEEI